MPRCTIVIPMYNLAALTRRCLDAIFADDQAPECAVIVVDDGSRESLGSLPEAYAARVRVLRHPTNLGFARSCNDGAAVAMTEFVVFLNNDTAPTAGWLRALIEMADAHPNAAVVGAKLLFPNDTIQHAGVAICHDGMPRHIYAGFSADHPAVNAPRRYQIVSAACALVRRAPFLAAGGFDVGYRNGYEDVDLCLRLAEQGRETWYCPTSVAYHFESLSEGRKDQETANEDRYRAQWAERVRPDDIDFYRADGLLDIRYEGLYPIRMLIAPELATVGSQETQPRLAQLLNARSRQVFELLHENIRLSLAQRRDDAPGAPHEAHDDE